MTFARQQRGRFDRAAKCLAKQLLCLFVRCWRAVVCAGVLVETSLIMRLNCSLYCTELHILLLYVRKAENCCSRTVLLLFMYLYVPGFAYVRQ